MGRMETLDREICYIGKNPLYKWGQVEFRLQVDYTSGERTPQDKPHDSILEFIKRL